MTTIGAIAPTSNASAASSQRHPWASRLISTSSLHPAILLIRGDVLNAPWLPSCITPVAIATDPTTSIIMNTTWNPKPTGANTSAP
jgi:hypothetical protein